jgi:hypothetical protein
MSENYKQARKEAANNLFFVFKDQNAVGCWFMRKKPVAEECLEL